MVINVTPMDIALGRRGNSWSCPIALATLRAVKRHRLKGFVSLGVSDVYLRIYVSHGLLPEIELPERICNWIQRFDDYGDVAPIRFSLEIPSAVA